MGLTHEQFVHDVRAAAVAWATARGTVTDLEAELILAAKLVYGAGDGRYRGVCHYRAWVNGVGPAEVVEIAAAGEESLVQVAGTTLHELGHVLAGWGAGHGADWKRACERLGLRRALAAGQWDVAGQGLGIASAPVGLWMREAGPGSCGQRRLPGPLRHLRSSFPAAAERLNEGAELAPISDVSRSVEPDAWREPLG